MCSRKRRRTEFAPKRWTEFYKKNEGKSPRKLMVWTDFRSDSPSRRNLATRRKTLRIEFPFLAKEVRGSAHPCLERTRIRPIARKTLRIDFLEPVKQSQGQTPIHMTWNRPRTDSATRRV